MICCYNKKVGQLLFANFYQFTRISCSCHLFSFNFRMTIGFISDTTSRILLTLRRVPTCSWYIISKCRSKKKQRIHFRIQYCTVIKSNSDLLQSVSECKLQVFLPNNGNEQQQVSLKYFVFKSSMFIQCICLLLCQHPDYVGPPQR